MGVGSAAVRQCAVPSVLPWACQDTASALLHLPTHPNYCMQCCVEQCTLLTHVSGLQPSMQAAFGHLNATLLHNNVMQHVRGFPQRVRAEGEPNIMSTTLRGQNMLQIFHSHYGRNRNCALLCNPSFHALCVHEPSSTAVSGTAARCVHAPGGQAVARGLIKEPSLVAVCIRSTPCADVRCVLLMHTATTHGCWREASWHVASGSWWKLAQAL